MSKSTNEKTTIYIDPKIKKSVRYYAVRDNRSLSEIVNDKLFEYLEEQADIATYDKAKTEYVKDSTTYVFNDVVKELGFDVKKIRAQARAESEKAA